MRKFVLSLIILASFLIISPVVHAQLQDFNFSGNDPKSYQCFDNHGNILAQEPVPSKDANGNIIEFYCTDSAGNKIKAVLKPPAFQELEIIFVRVVYAIWALVASFSFLMLIYLGYQYLISRGDPTQIKAIRERITKFIIGFALVFLAVPILVTFFRILGINNEVQCYTGLSGTNNVGIGFQFFYTDLCTDPRGLDTDPCDLQDLVNDLVNGTSNGRYACNQPGTFKSCNAIVGRVVGFCCPSDLPVWKVTAPADCK